MAASSARPLLFLAALAAVANISFAFQPFGVTGLLSPLRHAPATSRSPLSLRMGSSADASSLERPLSKLRLIQHKQEAFWFYRYLSLVYDKVVNPGHWTEDMREASLVPAEISAEQQIVDVGGGTGFCTLGVIKAGGKPGETSALVCRRTQNTIPGADTGGLLLSENIIMIDQVSSAARLCETRG